MKKLLILSLVVFGVSLGAESKGTTTQEINQKKCDPTHCYKNGKNKVTNKSKVFSHLFTGTPTPQTKNISKFFNKIEGAMDCFCQPPGITGAPKFFFTNNNAAAQVVGAALKVLNNIDYCPTSQQ